MEHFTLNEFAGLTQHKMRTTKPGAEKGADKVLTALTIDWSGISTEQMQELAALQIKTRLQNERRVAGVLCPPEETVKATDYVLTHKRRAKPAMTPEQMLAALSPEERAALIAKFLTQE